MQGIKRMMSDIRVIQKLGQQELWVFAFWNTVHREIRNKKCSGCENRNKSQPKNFNNEVMMLSTVFPLFCQKKVLYFLVMHPFTIQI